MTLFPICNQGKRSTGPAQVPRHPGQRALPRRQISQHLPLAIPTTPPLRLLGLLLSDGKRQEVKRFETSEVLPFCFSESCIILFSLKDLSAKTSNGESCNP